MKSAYIISNRELVQILGAHLRTQGFRTSDMTIRFTSTNAVVAGISKVSAEVESYSDEEEGSDEDDSDEEEHLAALANQVLDGITEQPRTIRELSNMTGLCESDVVSFLGDFGEKVAKVAPAREDGETVSMYMKTGTEAFDAFVAGEKIRVAAVIEQWKDAVLLHVPKFYEEGGDRMAILERICCVRDEEDAEAIRKDCRNVFYGMAEQNLLYHNGNEWKAFRTPADEQTLDMLRGAVKEIEGHESMSVGEVAEKLPGFADLGLLQHAMRG
jgi:hypothetical protein